MQLHLENLTLRRGARLLMRDFSLNLAAGESVLIKGPNGVGKTTLLRAIAGFIKPETGHINLSDNAATQTPPLSEALHYIGHKNGVRASLTVLENLEFWQQFYNPVASLGTIAEAFALTPLANIKAGYLSEGQQRRLALSRLAIAPRPLWLLDEPTVSLDVNSSEMIANIAQSHVEKGGLLMVISHIPLSLQFTKEIELEPLKEHHWEALI